MSRTIVISDLHGDARLLERVLEHAHWSPGDRLIIAGDLVDVGPEDAVAAAMAAGATVLAGNHEVAAALGIRIRPQHASSLEEGPAYLQRFANGEWPLAATSHGWLITHAGVSVALDDVISRAACDVDQIADALNRMFAQEAADALTRIPLSAEDLQRYRLMGGELGPLWFRPERLDLVPGGLRQIVGHTPPEMLASSQREALDARGWRLIEPGGHAGDGPAIRYALVTDHGAHVVEA